jgi:hypothetical protein
MIVRETEEHRQNNQRVGNLLEESWGVQVKPTEKLASWDFEVFEPDGVRFAIAEIKNRMVESTKYPDLLLSFDKYSKMIPEAIMEDVIPMYIWTFTDDKVLWVDLRKVDVRRCRKGGRTDRSNAPNDIEPVIFVPVEELNDL